MPPIRYASELIDLCLRHSSHVPQVQIDPPYRSQILLELRCIIAGAELVNYLEIEEELPRQLCIQQRDRTLEAAARAIQVLLASQ